MTAKEFFEQYPEADEVLVVGDNCFFSAYKGSAQDYAKRMGLTVENVKRGDAQTGEAGEEAIRKPAKKK